jgi:NitT/TauT family transport system substrate-binding protein
MKTWVCALLAGLFGLAGCSETGPGVSAVRLGYFANVTHAPAIVGIERGWFAEALGSEHALQTSMFNAGPEAVEALFSEALDISYIGPNPAINAFAQSGGEAVRIVAGATSGGAALVVQPSITAPAQLFGAVLATPQLGNTQDVALRAWLKQQGLRASLEGGGDVSILPQANAQTLETFRSGEIAGAWVPEPWATRLVLEGGGSLLVDERALWPDGRFVTTHVIVRTRFLAERPDLVASVLRAHVRAVDYLNAEPAAAREIANAGIAKVTGKPLPVEVIDAAWENLAFTVDPIAASLRKSAEDATAVGLLEPVKLDGIYDLRTLNQILAAEGKPQIAL